MHLLVTPFTFFEVAVFLLALAALLLAVRFFIASQRKFENLLPDRKAKRAHFGVGIDRDGFLVPTRPARMPAEKQASGNEETKQEIKELRDMLQLQQLELTRALRQFESLSVKKERDNYDERDYYWDNEEEPEEQKPLPVPKENLVTEELRQQLTRKEAENRELRQQLELNQKLHQHFEDVQSGYEELQAKVQKMEQLAWQSAELAIKVDNLEQATEQLERTLHKKEEKIRELSVENGRMHETLNSTEDKLTEANLQRQQLMKKVQFLEEINHDIQQMSDANRKLKSELRRVAELESMLNLITEERDALLKRRKY